MLLFPMSSSTEPSGVDALGAMGHGWVAAGIHQRFYELLDRPAWQLTGTSLVPLDGPIPSMVTVADDLRMMENIVDHVGAAGFIEHLMRSRVRLAGRVGLLVVYHAPTLREALDFLVGFIGRTHPYVAIDATIEADALVYRVRPTLSLGRCWPAIATLIPLALQQFVEQVVSPDMGRLRIDMDSALGGDQERYKEWFRCDVRIVQGDCALAIPLAMAERRNETGDPTLFAVACHQMDAEIHAADPSPESSRVRAVLRKVLVERRRLPDLGQVASILRMSERTLIRRLAREHTSFRALLDEQRRTQALALITDPAMSLQSISDVLGFPDRSTFGRKFLAWTGETPAGYRARRLIEKVSVDRRMRGVLSQPGG